MRRVALALAAFSIVLILAVFIQLNITGAAVCWGGEYGLFLVTLEDKSGTPVPNLTIEVYYAGTSTVSKDGFTRITNSGGQAGGGLSTCGNPYDLYVEGELEVESFSVPYVQTLTLDMDITPPSISNVTVSPINPTYLDSVDIFANITDASSISSVTLYWSEDQTNWTPIEMSIIAPDMYKSDTPIPAHTNKKRIYYYLNVSDENGYESTSQIYSYDITLELNLDLNLPAQVSKHQNFIIYADITNTGDSTLEDVTVELNAHENFSSSDPFIVPLGDLISGVSKLVNWILMADYRGEYIISVNVTSTSHTGENATHDYAEIFVSDKPPTIRKIDTSASWSGIGCEPCCCCGAFTSISEYYFPYFENGTDEYNKLGCNYYYCHNSPVHISIGRYRYYGKSSVTINFDVSEDGVYDIYLPRIGGPPNDIIANVDLDGSRVLTQANFYYAGNPTEHYFIPLTDYWNPPTLSAGSHTINIEYETSCPKMWELTCIYYRLLLVKRTIEPVNPQITNVSFKSSLAERNTQEIFVETNDNSEIETVEISITTPVSSIETLTLSLIDGHTWNGTWKVSVDAYEAGDYSFIVNVSDTYGNSLQSQLYSFDVYDDTTPPTISDINYEVNIATKINFTAASFHLNAKVSDDVDVSSVKMVITDPYQNKKTMESYANGGGKWYFSSEIYLLGLYTFQIEATDVNGNVKTTEEYQFEVTGYGCGDGICNTTINETYSNCCIDCPCPSGQMCQNNECVPEETTSGGISGPTTPSQPVNVTKKVEEIVPGEVANITIYKEEMSIEEIHIEVKNPVKDIEVNIVKLPEKPAQVVHEVIGKVYEYLELNLDNVTDMDIEKATIGFRVGKMWIVKNKINKSTVKLNRYFNGSWHKMPTILVGESPEFVYYETEVPGFSIFAITGEEIEEPKICTPDEKRCINNNLEQCNVDGTAWSILETCENGCNYENHSCNPPPAIGVGISPYIFFAIAVISVAAIVLYFKSKPEEDIEKTMEGFS